MKGKTGENVIMDGKCYIQSNFDIVVPDIKSNVLILHIVSTLPCGKVDCKKNTSARSADTVPRLRS